MATDGKLSEVQKNVLLEAVNTCDPKLIASCILNIDEIYSALKQLTSTEDQNCCGDDSYSKTGTIDDGSEDFNEPEIKQEPDCDDEFTEALESTHHQQADKMEPRLVETLDTPNKPTALRRSKRSTTKYTRTSVDSIDQTNNVRCYSSKRSHECTVDECNFRASSKSMMTKHMITSHPEHCKPFQCTQCDFSTIKRANYRQHLKTHLAPEDKPYKCQHKDCTYSSANREGLKIHLNSTHKGIKPFLCDMCGQSFTGISMLSKHKLMKHKPKHLSCDFCDYKTSLQTWLKDHMRKHSSETPYTCQYCTYAAKKPGRLKVHLRIHTGERPYKCYRCDYAAMEGAPLKKHLKNQHNLIVQRIDIREGKLYLENGSIIDTGVKINTQPLPPGSFKNHSTSLAGTEENNKCKENSLNMINDGTSEVFDNIIAQAAKLSALPVKAMSSNHAGHSMNENTDESGDANYVD